MWDNKNELSVWIWTGTGNVQCGYGGERSEKMETNLTSFTRRGMRGCGCGCVSG